jgi:hypothetical protein
LREAGGRYTHADRRGHRTRGQREEVPVGQLRVTRRRAVRRDAWAADEQEAPPPGSPGGDDTAAATLSHIDEVLAEA